MTTTTYPSPKSVFQIVNMEGAPLLDRWQGSVGVGLPPRHSPAFNRALRIYSKRNILSPFIPVKIIIHNTMASRHAFRGLWLANRAPTLNIRRALLARRWGSSLSQPPGSDR